MNRGAEERNHSKRFEQGFESVRTVYKWFERFLQSQFLRGVLKLHELGYLSPSELISGKTLFALEIMYILASQAYKDEGIILEIRDVLESECVV